MEVFSVEKVIVRSRTKLKFKYKYIIGNLVKKFENESYLWGYSFLSIIVKCLYFQFTTQINRIPVFTMENVMMLIATVCNMIIINSIVILAFNKNRVKALFGVNLNISALLVCDTNFFRYYYGIITIPVILQVDIKLASSIEESIMSLFKFKDIIYIFDIPVLLYWMSRLQKKGVKKIAISKRIIAFAVSMAVGLTGFITVYARTEKDIIVYNNNYVTKKLGVLYSHYDSFKKYVIENSEENESLSKQERDYLAKYFEHKPKTGRDHRGIAKEKNLIIVQVEALQQFLINRKINGVDITPNLNRLIDESLYFDNIYYQVAGGNTSDAELLVNTSLYPAEEGAAFVRFAENKYYSLPQALNSIGYNTYSLHAFTSKFWNRTEMYKALGFGKFIDDTYYVMDDFAGWEGDALSDASFFRQSLDLIDISEPFYAFFITLSSHYPFTYFEESYNFNVGELEGTFIGNYIKAARYADECLGQFIDQLKDKGLFDDSLLVVYGDHSGVPRHLSDELVSFVNVEFSDAEWVKLQKVPLIIHYPGFKNGETISTIGGQIDILPTIANLMDFEVPYALGKDLLNTKTGYAVLRNGTVITDKYIYIAELNEMYSAIDNKIIRSGKYEKDAKLLLNQLKISDLILEKDALRIISNNGTSE
jgi:lipoteichoic acid synthase